MARPRRAGLGDGDADRLARLLDGAPADAVAAARGLARPAGVTVDDLPVRTGLAPAAAGAALAALVAGGARVSAGRALGAGPAWVVRLGMRGGGSAGVAGTAAGFAAAFAASVLLRRFVFGGSPTDPARYRGATACLVALALAAGWLPARRAAGIEAVEALRGH